MNRWLKLWYRIRYGTSWDGVIVGAIFAGLFVLLIVHLRNEHQARAGLGEPCSYSSDCRSRSCLDLYEPTALPIVAERRGGLCSDDCERDEDCPASMQCGPVVASTGPPGARLDGPIPIGDPNALACVPRGR